VSAAVGLARALHRNERLSVLKLALVAFDHDVIEIHDKLCNAGAMAVLVRFLQVIMSSNEIHWDEVYQCAALIEMTFRCSDEAAVHVTESIGADLVLLCFSVLLKNDNRKYEGSSVKIIVRKIAGLEVSLRKMDKSERLLSFLQQMAMLGNEDPGVSCEAVCVLAGLTSHTESKALAMQNPSFLDSIIRCSQLATPSTESKRQIARIIQNLTLDGSNKAKLTQHYTVELLVKLALPDQTIETRDQALRCLKNLAIETKSKVFLVSYEGGQVLKVLLECLTDLQSTAMDAIACLACNSTAFVMASHSGLIEALATHAHTTNSQSAEKAAQTIKRLSTYVSTTHRQHPALFDAIIFLTRSKNPRILLWAAKSFLEQARLSGSNFLLLRSPEALECVADLARHDVCRDAAIETLLVLTQSQSNLKRFTINEYLIDTLAATVDEGMGSDGQYNETARKAILALLNLTQRSCARKRAKKHRSLVNCLFRYGRSSDGDEELRQAALHGVIVLSQCNRLSRTDHAKCTSLHTAQQQKASKEQANPHKIRDKSMIQASAHIKHNQPLNTFAVL